MDADQQTEQQTEIILREQWINLAGCEAANALFYGASGEEIMQAVDGTAQTHALDGAGQKNAQLRRVARATLEAVQRGASVEHVKARIAVSLSNNGTLSQEYAASLLGLDIGFRKLCEDMATVQKEALRLTVDPATFRDVFGG
jgi:hypothetical protein